MKRAAHGIERVLRGLSFFSQHVWATVPMRLYLWNHPPPVRHVLSKSRL